MPAHAAEFFRLPRSLCRHQDLLTRQERPEPRARAHRQILPEMRTAHVRTLYLGRALGVKFRVCCPAAHDAVVIDSSELTPAHVVDEICRHLKKRTVEC